MLSKIQTKPYPLYVDEKGVKWMAVADLVDALKYKSSSGIRHILQDHAIPDLSVRASANRSIFYPESTILRICSVVKKTRPWAAQLENFLQSSPTGPNPAFWWRGKPVWTAKQIPGAELMVKHLTLGKDYAYVPKRDLERLGIYAAKKLLVFFSPNNGNYKKMAESLGMMIAHSKTPAESVIEYIIAEKGAKDPVAWVKDHGSPRYIGDFCVEYPALSFVWDNIVQWQEYQVASDKLKKLTDDLRTLLGKRHTALLMDLDEIYGIYSRLTARPGNGLMPLRRFLYRFLKSGTPKPSIGCAGTGCPFPG